MNLDALQERSRCPALGSLSSQTDVKILPKTISVSGKNGNRIERGLLEVAEIKLHALLLYLSSLPATYLLMASGILGSTS